MSDQAGGAESKVVVFAALAGNVAIATVKGIAFALTQSTAMLSETIHSCVDSLDQVLLLIGQSRASRPPDAGHPFGHGLEIYFWSFTVALMVFLAGGLVSLYEGVEKLLHPTPLRSGWVNGAVLAAAFLFEGASLTVGVRQANKVRRGRVSLLNFIKRSKDPNLFVTLLEDGAALIGLAVAAFGVAGSTVLGWPWADGAASVVIGLLLMVVAGFLASETRSLIAGEAADPSVVAKLQEALKARDRAVMVHEIATLQLGPQTILVAITADFGDREPIEAVTRELTQALKAADPRVDRVYFRPPPGGDVASPEPSAA